MSVRRVKPCFRKLSLQSLEKRQLMAAYINELMVDPLFGSGDGRQYIELRGEPDRAFDPGTYFAVISDRGIGEINPGVIHGIFDLSGQRFGSNGIMLILPQASRYPLSETLEGTGLQPTILRSTEPGFGGLPGDIYSDLHPISETIDFILGSNSYLLLQSDTKPTLAQDIDANNDGIIDEASNASKWNVLDSVSLHHGVFTGSTAYGRTLYIEDNFPEKPNQVLTSPDTVVVRGGGFGYAARIGDSTGAKAEDWIFSTARDQGTNNVVRYRLEEGIFGVPLPRVFLGRDLDHIGESNFIGGVRGKFTQTALDDTGTPITTPITGVKVLADSNRNGVRDVIRYSADPDSFALNTELTNVFTGATLSITGDNFGPTGFDVTSVRESFFNELGNRVYSHAGINFLNSSRQLRVDFYRPARSVSIEAIGSTGITYGRLEAFNAKGESLGFVRTGPLQNGNRQRISLGYNDDVIAFALAYSDDNFQNSSPFGMLDGLEYSQMEAIAETDANGEYSLGRLYPDNYNIIAKLGSDTRFAKPLAPLPITINRYENFRFDFDGTLNTDPKVTPAEFTVTENPTANARIGEILATDVNSEQTISFSIDQANSPVRINATTGELFIAKPDGFDFETNPILVVPVIVTDSVGGATRSDVIIKVTNVDEPPVVKNDRHVITEGIENDEAFGRLDAIDPDSPEAILDFSITGGTGANVFAIDKNSGVLRVANAGLVNFETNASLTLNVKVSDRSTPPSISELTVNVEIIDVNEAPLITSTTFSIPENASLATNVGTVLFSDADIGQTHSFSLLDNTEGLFKIDVNTGVISVAAALDFESARSHEINVQLVDSGIPLQGTVKTITVNVTNVDEPATLEDSEFSLFEDATPGTLIGTLVVADPDGKVVAKYRSSNPSEPTKLFGGRVVIDPITGKLSVAPGAAFDADGLNAVLEDKVIILDGDKVIGESSVKLILANVNEPPTVAPQRFGLPKGLPGGRVFAEVAFSDPEKQDVDIDVIGEASALFGVDNDRRLFLRPGVTVDFTNKAEIEIEFEITDQLGLKSRSKSVVFEGPLPKFGTEIPDKTVISGSDVVFSLPPAFRSDSVKSLKLIAPSGALPAGLEFDPIVARLSGIPAPSVKGTFEFVVEVLEIDGDAELLKSETFSLQINRSDKPLLNKVNPFDVDGNKKVEPIDALRVLNFLSRFPTGRTAADLVDSATFFVDTNGSNNVTALDALIIINHLGREAHNKTVNTEPTAAPIIGVSTSDKAIKDQAIISYLADPELF